MHLGGQTCVRGTATAMREPCTCTAPAIPCMMPAPNFLPLRLIQGMRFIFTDGSRIVFRVSGTGVVGAGGHLTIAHTGCRCWF